jgi:nicotinamide-nucleotide adenylyltransferase
MMTEYGVVHGRFQIVHNDHVKYIMAAKKRCSNLIIGVTNPDPLHTKSEFTDSNRSNSHANPLTYFERHYMIRAVLLEKGLDAKEFIIVPFPISAPDYCKYYVPSNATFYLTIYDRWGEEKYDRLKSLGFQVEVLWRKPIGEKGITSTNIRNLISAGKDYRHLIPTSVYEMVKEWKIDLRIQHLHGRI